MARDNSRAAKVLVIGNYPPTRGRAIQTYWVTAELRRGRQVCDVLNINEHRRVKSPDKLPGPRTIFLCECLPSFEVQSPLYPTPAPGSHRTGLPCLPAEAATVIEHALPTVSLVEPRHDFACKVQAVLNRVIYGTADFRCRDVGGYEV
jgi:hypothetical protein